jgi:hypothetical protein
MNLKKGDRVVVISEPDDRPDCQILIGLKGTILYANHYQRCLVEFDIHINGHNGNVNDRGQSNLLGKAGHCWYIDEKYLENINEKEENQMSENSRTLYSVTIVEPITGEILLDKKIVASSKEEALIELDVKAAIKNLKLKDVDVITNALGNVRPVVSETPVRIVGEAGSFKLVKEK